MTGRMDAEGLRTTGRNPYRDGNPFQERMMRRVMLVVVAVVLGACGAVVEPRRCTAFETVRMADSTVNVGALEICVAYD